MGDLSDSISNFSACSARSTDTESSWTPYIVDFVIHNNSNSGNGSFSSGAVSNHHDDTVHRSSTMSDAAGTDGADGRRKKKKTKQVDDALEDTASSPGNSPKVFCIERQDRSYPTKRDHRLDFNNIVYQEKLICVQREERREFGFDNIRRETTESTALKKKGLRLVPVSMVVKCQLADS